MIDISKKYIYLNFTKAYIGLMELYLFFKGIMLFQFWIFLKIRTGRVEKKNTMEVDGNQSLFDDQHSSTHLNVILQAFKNCLFKLFILLLF